MLEPDPYGNVNRLNRIYGSNGVGSIGYSSVNGTNAGRPTQAFEQPQFNISPDQFLANQVSIGNNAVPIGEFSNNSADSIVQNAINAPAPAALPPVQTLPVQQSQPVLDADALRNQALGLVNNQFGVNYGSNSISDNFLDSTINDLVNSQQTNAQDYLARGKARGIYNDIGFEAGQNTINNSADAGRSNIADLARGVLDKYQARANVVRDDAFNAASTVGSGTPFQIDPYVERGEVSINDANRYAAGDLKGAFGNTNLFDFGKLNNKAGQAQGSLNLRDTDLATAVKERNRVDTQSRGIGNTGAF